MFNGTRILVAPLDWGLGHATRCVPIVRALLERGATPVIGADKAPLALLRDEFPQLPAVRIPGIDVRYGKGRSQAWAMTKQFPAMLRSIRAERRHFDRLRRDVPLDAVISDQRFGIRTPGLPGVLITHQVFPFTPVAQGMLRRINLHHIRSFDRCWVPDEAALPGLAGELSHGPRMPANARYIGPISRFAKGPAGTGTVTHRIVAVISGPEPQRTLLERSLTAQLQRIEGPHLLVLGRPDAPKEQRIGDLTIVGHLNAQALREAMLHAGMIISRTGYTTLMDLARIGRTALLVPTPGQAEQEYLGQLHGRTGRFLVQAQDRLDIAGALRVLEGRASAPAATADTLASALDDLAALIAARR